MSKSNKTRTFFSNEKARALAAVGVFTALAYICCVLFHFKVSFLSFDLKDAVMTIGAMFFGPAYGFAMSLLVSTIELATISSTGLYGYIMNILSSVVFVCVGSFIYTRHRSMLSALLGMITSVIAMTVVMLGANLLITPFYMNVTVEDVRALILPLLLPFNLTKAIFNAALVFLLYKPVSTALKSARFLKHEDDEVRIMYKPKLLALVIPLVIAAAALVFFFVYLHGSFEIG
ncbi:MAG: ECF transporter S component [Clostridia bacterium]|nr:ECF transporter S component [Clostridia bacterium]